MLHQTPGSNIVATSTRELANWAGSPYLLDTYTIFGREPRGRYRRLANVEHMKEMEIIRMCGSSIATRCDNVKGASASSPNLDGLAVCARRSVRTSAAGAAGAWTSYGPPKDRLGLEA